MLCPAGTIGRANEPINKHVSSQAEIELPPGVLYPTKQIRKFMITFFVMTWTTGKNLLQNNNVVLSSCRNINIVDTGASAVNS